MEKTIIDLAYSGLTIRAIAEHIGCSPTNVRHHLKKNGISTLGLRREKEKAEKHCPRCDTTKALDQFYTRRSSEPSTYCKACSVGEAMDRQARFKQACVDYKGGVCLTCGYHECLAALEFHHLDPTQKDFAISRGRGYAFTAKVKDELDKCVLLCCRCHREVHAGVRNI